jgi:hypothetical protein
VPEPIATWNPARGVWETAETNLLCGHSVPFSETWPKSGSMRSGRAFARPTRGHLTAASASSSSPGLLPTPVVTNRAGMTPSAATVRGTRGNDLGPVIGALLKTPTAQLAVNGGSQHPDKRRAGGHGPTLADQIEQELTASSGSSPSSSPLLPTPTAQDARHGWNHRRGGDRASEPVLQSVAQEVTAGALLPTPTAHDSSNTPENHLRKKPGRSQVTSLQVILDYGLLPSGGHIAPPSADGKPSSDAPLPGQLSLDELADD